MQGARSITGAGIKEAVTMTTKAIAIDEKAPLFVAKDHQGKTIVLSELLEKGPVILVFYRGQWCPICNRHLKVALYNTMLVANLPKAHGDETVILPVPATYLIGKDGLIKYVHFDPDYRKRSDPGEVLAALSGL